MMPHLLAWHRMLGILGCLYFSPYRTHLRNVCEDLFAVDYLAEMEMCQVPILFVENADLLEALRSLDYTIW